MTDTNKKEDTEILNVYMSKKGQEAGKGIMAFVHTNFRGVKLTAKIVKSDKGTFGLPPSNRSGNDFYPYFRFAKREDSDAWSEAAVNAYEEELAKA